MPDHEKEKARKRRYWRKRCEADPAFRECERERLKLLARAIRAKARELDNRKS